MSQMGLTGRLYTPDIMNYGPMHLHCMDEAAVESMVMILDVRHVGYAAIRLRCFYHRTLERHLPYGVVHENAGPSSRAIAFTSY